jgi:hypothetical protein
MWANQAFSYMLEPQFPLGANLPAVFLAFAIFLVAFDIILVRWLKLSKVTWKKVDYVWLGFASLGIFSAVSQVRVMTANAQADMFREGAVLAFSSLRYLADSNASDPGAICRTFVRSEYSPPPGEFDSTQREYNQACEWAKHVARTIPAKVPTPAKPISQGLLPARPSASAGDLKEMIDGLYFQFDVYNKHSEALSDLSEETKRTGTEDILIYFGPLLLVIALALRITKVTGEIRLES